MTHDDGEESSLLLFLPLLITLYKKPQWRCSSSVWQWWVASHACAHISPLFYMLQLQLLVWLWLRETNDNDDYDAPSLTDDGDGGGDGFCHYYYLCQQQWQGKKTPCSPPLFIIYYSYKYPSGNKVLPSLICSNSQLGFNSLRSDY